MVKLSKGVRGDMMSLLEVSSSWLNDIAKGNIKTYWGKIMQAENPLIEEDKVMARLRKKHFNIEVIESFRTLAPILAERLAIVEYSHKNPDIKNMVPEISTYQDALEIAVAKWNLTEKEQCDLLELLITDETMQLIGVNEVNFKLENF